MSKKNRQAKMQKQPVPPVVVPKRASPLSRRGKKMICLGVGVLVLGFFILTLTDPAGRNWASILSPLLLISGYMIIGVGIVLPNPSALSPSSASDLPSRVV